MGHKLLFGAAAAFNLAIALAAAAAPLQFYRLAYRWDGAGCSCSRRWRRGAARPRSRSAPPATSRSRRCSCAGCGATRSGRDLLQIVGVTLVEHLEDLLGAPQLVAHLLLADVVVGLELQALVVQQRQAVFVVDVL